MHHRGSFRFLSIAFGCFLVLSGPFITPERVLYAQQLSSGQTPADLYQALTPEQRQALENLSPDQRQALQAEVMKSGGKVTPEMIERVKAQQQGPQAPSQATPPAVISPQETREIKAAAEKGEKQFEKKIDKEFTERKGKTVPEPRRFGLDLFEPSRKRIFFLEDAISKGQTPAALQRDALSGFIGPLDMVTSSVNASAPPQYVLNPGDRITVYYWGDLIELTTLNLVLDEKGEVSVPKAGRFVARGMSLPQLQKAVQDQLQRVFGKDVKLIASLDRLNSIQIQITGDAFRPGSYAVSAVTTLFNALFAAGGPNEHGSLRDIRLVRKSTIINVDFYDYLLNGDSRSDLPLQAGDTVYIGATGKLISVAGEVVRPAVYELKKNETLKDLVRMAGGIKPTGLNNRIHIQSVVPNKEKTVVDVDLSGKDPAADYAFFDGDSVAVGTIVQETANQVTLSGNVKVPGVYELKKSMRVADLFNEVNQPWGEAYLERADIIRLDEDRKTTTLIPINLEKALKKDPEHNIELAHFDRIVVYSKWDVKFYPERTVMVRGAVQKPGDYERSEGMTIKDLLLKAGNVVPDAFLVRADLVRYIFEKDMYLTVPVNLEKLLAGDERENILLTDRDALTIYTQREAGFTPPREVEVRGSVQRPDKYTRSEGMRISDLLVQAGGLLPDTFLERADLLRYMFDKDAYLTIPVNLGRLLAGDERENILLNDRDALRIYTLREAAYIPPHEVEIRGSVQRPGKYTRSEGMRLRDLLVAAGGVLPGIGNEITIAKAGSFDEIRTVTVKLDLLEKGEESQNVPLDDQDIVMVREYSEFFDRPRWVTIGGEVRFPGTYPLIRKDYRLNELLEQAGGLTKTANPKGTVFLRDKGLLPSPEQRDDLLAIDRIVNALNESDAKRLSARNLLLLQREGGVEATGQGPAVGAGTVIATGTSAKDAAALSLAPSIAQATGTLTGGLVSAFTAGGAMTSQARTLSDEHLSQSTRIIVDVRAAMEDRDNPANTVLMSGDSIIVPQRTETASVVGAVMNPVTVHIGKNRKVKSLIALAGGYASDADEERVLVLRVDGSIMPAEDIAHVEEGDILYVPTRVVTTEIITTADKIINVIKYTLATAAGVIVFLALIP